MTSQIDLDQGGTFRTLSRMYLGPTIGWVAAPSSILPITAAGTVQVQPGVTLVTVSVAGLVTVKLPSAINPIVGAGALPGPFIDLPITIVDIGGNANANNITIQPFSVSENIMGLASIKITINYGGFTLVPISSTLGWNSISP